MNEVVIIGENWSQRYTESYKRRKLHLFLWEELFPIPLSMTWLLIQSSMYQLDLFLHQLYFSSFFFLFFCITYEISKFLKWKLHLKYENAWLDYMNFRKKSLVFSLFFLENCFLYISVKWVCKIIVPKLIVTWNRTEFVVLKIKYYVQLFQIEWSYFSLVYMYFYWIMQ